MTTVHEFQAKTIDGADQSLADYRGKALLIVNVASACGLTPHYAGLQELHSTYGGRGFAVLGFPCNQFGAQEPGTEGEIKTFCETKFGVTFPMFSKIDVNGAEKHPLYDYLESFGGGPAAAGDVLWNFEKFVVGKDGKVIARFGPKTAPSDPTLVETIEAAL